MTFFSQEIYIVRHGETDYNKKKIVQGRGVDSDLNEVGQGQAAAFFNAYQDEGFDQIFASNLKRTYQTIERFEQKAYQITKHPELDEISWGGHEGKSPSKAIHEEYLRMKKKWESGEFDEGIEGGESVNDVAKRLGDFLKKNSLTPQTGKVLICTHGRTATVLLCLLLGLPFQEMERFRHGNTACTKLVWNGEGYGLVFQNRLSHILEAT